MSSDPTTQPTSRLSSLPQSSVYTFSHVFPPGTSQSDFFARTTLSLVKDVLEGQSGLLFAYGATNSGKTYTMQGGHEEGSAGILPRTLDVVFNSIEGLHGDGRVSAFAWRRNLSLTLFSSALCVCKASRSQLGLPLASRRTLPRDTHPTSTKQTLPSPTFSSIYPHLTQIPTRRRSSSTGIMSTRSGSATPRSTMRKYTISSPPSTTPPPPRGRHSSTSRQTQINLSSSHAKPFP